MRSRHRGHDVSQRERRDELRVCPLLRGASGWRLIRLCRFQDAQAPANGVHDGGLAELVLLWAAGEGPRCGAYASNTAVGDVACRGRVGPGEAGGNQAKAQAALLLCGVWGAIDVPERAAALE